MWQAILDYVAISIHRDLERICVFGAVTSRDWSEKIGPHQLYRRLFVNYLSNVIVKLFMTASNGSIGSNTILKFCTKNEYDTTIWPRTNTDSILVPNKINGNNKLNCHLELQRQKVSIIYTFLLESSNGCLSEDIYQFCF